MSPFLKNFKRKNRNFVNGITKNNDNQKLIYNGEVPVKIGLVLDRIKQPRENFELPQIFKIVKILIRGKSMLKNKKFLLVKEVLLCRSFKNQRVHAIVRKNGFH